MANGGRAEVVEKAADLDAVLRAMGQPAQQVPSVLEGGPADLSVHRRADRHTDEAARFPVPKLDRLTVSDNASSWCCDRKRNLYRMGAPSYEHRSRDPAFDGGTCSRSTRRVLLLLLFFFSKMFFFTTLNVMGLSKFKNLIIIVVSMLYLYTLCKNRRASESGCLLSISRGIRTKKLSFIHTHTYTIHYRFDT